MTTLIIATRNRHKVEEIRAIWDIPAQWLTLNEFPAAPVLIEDADTFAGNAARKATQLAAWLGLQAPAVDPRYVLADDSGLEVDALDGAPGVYSARFATEPGQAGNSSDAANNAKLLRLLGGVPLARRTARFRCALALVKVSPQPPLPAPWLFEGACEGHIQFQPAGQGGFGYDPLFIPAGHTQSFAELGAAVKNQLSHRSQALRRLREAWERGAWS